MSLPSYRDAELLGNQYLQQMADLKGEMINAIEALAKNSLTQFEHSLWQQEMLSLGMRRSVTLLSTLALPSALLAQLRAAGAALQLTCHTYGAVLEQCSASTTLLGGLCTLHQMTPQQPASSPHALSCEA